MRLWIFLLLVSIIINVGDAFRRRRRRRSCGAVNGGWSGWGSWSSCSCNHATGTGTWTRYRSCNNPAPSCGGSSCSGSSSMTGNCNSQCCQTTNGGWGSWSSWGSCSCNHATGTGTWTRSRSCNNPAPSCGGSSCSGSSSMTGNCSSQCCQTTNGGWGSWSSWGSCSCNHATGTGIWTRSRSCNNPAPSCGGSQCSGSATETGSCDSQCCKTVHGGMTSWSVWGACTCNHTTGTGTRTRTRSCTSPKPSCGGNSCVGATSEVGSCDDQCCKTVDGGLTVWGNWSTCLCNHNTGTGTRNRTRSCSNPAPYCYGKDCVGVLGQNGTCDDQCCKTVDGGLTDWGNWSTCKCDHSTGTGTKIRSRSCTSPAPSCFGRDCAGNLTEQGTCDDQCCQTVDGGLTAWGNWSTCLCNHNSGTGIRNRTRSCSNPTPSCHGKNCNGSLVDNGRCDDQCCKTVDGGLTVWGNWSTCLCNHNTGTGTRNRTRSCTNPAPSCYGKDCEGDYVQEEECDERCRKSVPSLFSKQGRLALRGNLLHAIIIILCISAILGIVIVVKGLLYSGKRRRAPEEEDKTSENYQLDEMPDSTQDETSYSDIEPKVRPSVESEDIVNDYIVFNPANVDKVGAKSSHKTD